MKRALCPLVAALPLLFLLGCDEGTPVAPSGAILTVSANPESIALFGESVITLTAQRSNGQPVNPGTEIFLTTDLGSIPAAVETDERGIARAVLEGRGTGGTATVQAVSGGATAEVEVAIGDPIESLSLTVAPRTLPSTGGTVNLRVLARDAQGDPIAGVSVVFSSETGTLASGGAIERTAADGTATDTLTVTEEEIDALGASSFEVGAEAISAGATVTATRTIQIESDDGSS